MSVLDNLGLKPDGAADEEGQASVDEGTPPKPPEAREAAPEPAEEPVEVPEGADKPDAVKALIQAERAKARESYKKAKELERQLQEKMEAEKPVEERLSGLEARAKEAELKALRLEVGVGSGLSVKLASRLTGTTAEELAQDAADLIAELGSKPKPQLPSLDGGVKQPPPAEANPARAHDNFLFNAITGNATKRGA